MKNLTAFRRLRFTEMIYFSNDFNDFLMSRHNVVTFNFYNNGIPAGKRRQAGKYPQMEKKQLILNRRHYMNNNELDNLRQDGSVDEKAAGNASSDKKSEDKSEQNNSNQGTEREGSIYSVGGRSGEAYNPPRSDSEYSLSRKQEIPDYRYTLSQNSQPAVPVKKKKKNRIGKTALVALLAAALILSAALAGFGGSLLAREFTGSDKAETTTGNDNLPTDETTAASNNNAGDSTAIIIKNNGSVSVETISGNIGDSDLSMPEVVALVKDSVVEITTETSVYNGRYVESGAGSGVIIGRSEDGKTVYIATNNHVIAGAEKINVRLTNGNEYAATLRGTDSTSDIAVITITVNESVTVAQLGSSTSLKVGESVIAIGNPLGELGGTVTNGIISALAREVDISGSSMTLLQTSAAVNPGNSGGGLFNMKGELIGVVNAKSSGENIDNIGFAIPVDTAYDIIKELIEYGYVTGRVDAGLTLIDVTDTYTAWYYGVSTLGVYVYESKYSTDIQSGDRIVSVNGVEVSSSAAIKSILGDCSVGDSVTVRVSRKGKQYDVSLILREYVPSNTVVTETTSMK